MRRVLMSAVDRRNTGSSESPDRRPAMVGRATPVSDESPLEIAASS